MPRSSDVTHKCHEHISGAAARPEHRQNVDLGIEDQLGEDSVDALGDRGDGGELVIAATGTARRAATQWLVREVEAGSPQPPPGPHLHIVRADSP